MAKTWPGFLFLCFFLCGEVQAQLPLIRLDRIFPLGASAGAEVVLEIAGKDLDDVKTLHFDHPGFKADLLKPNQFRVTIAGNTPAGTYEVRAVGKYGISGSRLFAVSRGLTEVRKSDGNDDLTKAQTVPLNVVVNGLTEAGVTDFYRFPAWEGERLTLDGQALRLDSPMRPTLTLFTAAGEQLVQSKPYYHRTDPLLDWVAPATGWYILQVRDLTYLPDLPYRLIISNRPHLEHVFPPAVVPGEQATLTLVGRNLPASRISRRGTEQGQPLEELRLPFRAPREATALERFAFINHPPSPSLTVRGLQWQPTVHREALNPVSLVYATAPVTLEREPNDTPETAQPITLPTVICGRLDQPGDLDWYSFTAKAKQTIVVDLLCERLEMPGDLVVHVTDARGEALVAFDDHGTNFHSLAQFNRDPFGVFTAPADGTYRLLVHDRYRHGGPRFVYALRVGSPEADFFPVVFHETPVDPSCPVVRQGGSAFYELCLNRRHFAGPVTVEAEGLPAGVTCPPVHVSPQTEFATLVFTAAGDAPEWTGAIRLKAWAMIDGKRVEREVRCSQRRWANEKMNTSRVCREICLAVRAQAPYALTMPVGMVTVAAGGTFETKVTATRHWPDFKRNIQLNGLNLPPGFSVAGAEVPGDQGEVMVKWTVADTVPPGTYTVNLRGEAAVPFHRDPKAPEKSDVVVADPSTPLTVVVTAPSTK